MYYMNIILEMGIIGSGHTYKHTNEVSYNLINGKRSQS